MAQANGLAAAHASAGRPAEALQLYREAMAVEDGSGQQDEHAHAGIGDIHAGLGEHDQAREYWQRALVVYRELGMPQTEAVAARLGRLGTPTNP